MTCDVAKPFQCPVSHRKSLELPWYTTALLTVFSRHVLWVLWCSYVQCSSPTFRTKSCHEWDDCKAVLRFSVASISSSEYIVYGGEAGRSHSTKVGQGSMFLEAGEVLVVQKPPLEQGTSLAQCVHFRKITHNAVCCWHTDSSAGHLPHLLGNVKEPLQRHC